MTPSPSHIAEAFSRHDFTTATPHLAEDIVWDNVGSEPIVGRQAVVAGCDVYRFRGGMLVAIRSYNVEVDVEGSAG